MSGFVKSGVAVEHAELRQRNGPGGMQTKELESHTDLANFCRRMDILLDAIKNGAIVTQKNTIILAAATAEGVRSIPCRPRSLQGVLGR